MWGSRLLAWPPPSTALWTAAAAVTLVFGALVAASADAMAPYFAVVVVLFVGLAAVNLAIGFPRISLGVGFVGLAMTADVADVGPLANRLVADVVGWTFLLAGVAVVVHVIRSNAHERRMEEIRDSGGDAE